MDRQKEQDLWANVFQAAIAALVQECATDAAIIGAEYAANGAVEKFRSAFAETN